MPVLVEVGNGGEVGLIRGGDRDAEFRFWIGTINAVT